MSTAMLKNYLKIAFRNLWKKPGYSFINIFGLTIGLTCCLVIFQYVAFEYSFDRFHENGSDLYRITTGMASSGEELVAGGAYTPQAMAPALMEAIPEIANATRLHPEYEPALVSNPAQPDRIFEEQEIFYADPAFMEMFSFPLSAGSSESVLEPGSMLISQSAAQKYFGSANPVGQVLDVTGTIQKSYRITGVFKDVPDNSHLQFDFLLPMEDLLRSDQYNNEPEGGWSWNNFLTYIQLIPGANPAEVNQKLTQVFTNNREELMRQQNLRAIVEAQPLNDIHLNADITGPAGLMGSYRTVYFFTIIGLVTLLIALVNYVNLATARALDRAREVGVRKAVGAQRSQLVKQFFLESALTNFAAIVLAIALTELLRPFISGLAGIQIANVAWMNVWFWLALLGIFALSTLLAGLYPALVLSSFRPVSVLKGKGTGSVASQLWLRRSLVVLQFAAAVVLIGGTSIVYNQLNFMRNMDLGLDLEQVLTVSGPRVLPEGTDRAVAMHTFAEELQRIPAVRQVATSASLPGQGFNWNGASTRRAEDPNNWIRGVVAYVDTSFASLYGMELVAGRSLSEIPPSTGEDDTWSVVANETAVRSLGFASPQEAVNHALVIGDYDARIVGVLKDFNWSSAHEARQNIFFAQTNTGLHVSIRLDAGNLPSTIASVERIFTEMFPGNVFTYAFVDEAFDAQYRNDQRFAALFSMFAGLAIAIACLGLFGLASFTMSQRTKEVGIRKVLGASVPRLVALLSQDFIKLVAVSVLMGSAVTYLLMNRWLTNFAYRIDIGAGVFLLAGGVVLLIALATVSWQSVRAALANPVESLRSE